MGFQNCPCLALQICKFDIVLHQRRCLIANGIAPGCYRLEDIQEVNTAGLIFCHLNFQICGGRGTCLLKCLILFVELREIP